MSKDSGDYFELGVGGHKKVTGEDGNISLQPVLHTNPNRCLNSPVAFAIKPISQSPNNPENYLLKLPAVVRGIDHTEYHYHKLPDLLSNRITTITLSEEILGNLRQSAQLEYGFRSDCLLAISELLICHQGNISTHGIFITIEPNTKKLSFRIMLHLKQLKSVIDIKESTKHV